MNRQRTCRPAWVKYGLLLVLVAGGGAGGLYLSGAWSDQQPGKTGNGGESTVPGSACTHRFPLTPRDAKDTVEAPDLAADATGRVFLTWASKTGEAERTVYLTRTLDVGRTFDAPRALTTGGVFRSGSRGKKDGHERRATPHLAAIGPELHLTWSQADLDGSHIRLLLATSADAGATFDAPRAVHQEADANPTFTALGVGPGGEIACAWLGGPVGQQPFGAVRRAGASTFEAERLVHAGQDGKGVCPCCPLATCFAPDGTLCVAFRNIAEGYRDIAIGILRPGQAKFEGPFPVVPPAWKFSGCPHDGPSMVVRGEHLHIVWMDARSESPRCYHARARLADMAFTSEALHPISIGTQGNAKLHLDAAGQLHVVWEESGVAPPAEVSGKHQHGAPTLTPGAGGRAIQHATLGSDGRFGSPQAVAPRPGAFQTRPAIVVTSAGRIVMAWNELDEFGKAIVVHSVAGCATCAEGGRP
jgi:hypothetical protein